ncbi:alpha/beta-hydrolase [Ceraceosorus guamensis]|uniref:Alpha/beta-hydrolase n=1 Tax=Ceraceosorus guamensis TaxID=1522189 RepID=A0A316VQ98_9BASI|nr:alpha/beta-hydrolase [Ceraceosorus guamensis]PWN39424.1 alpha/beta-hydrolase [Ceraceosorus guamensis]
MAFPAISSDPIDLSPLPISPPKAFQPTFTSEAIEGLHSRIASARLPEQDFFWKDEDRRSWRLKPSLERVKEILKGWKQFDVKQFESEINKYPHFTTSIGWCERMHFIHVRSERKDAIPLMLIHGWPGSFLEFIHLIPSLTFPSSSNDPAFHLIIPSLPGFAYSSAPPSSTSGTGDYLGYSRLLDSLMRGLGYDRYAAQGGDWGSAHVRALGSRFHKQDGTGCRAVHFNFMPVSPSPGIKLAQQLPDWILTRVVPWLYDQEHCRMIAKANYFEANLVYYKVQCERFAQLSYGLLDSPSGLASWIGAFFGISLLETYPFLSKLCPPIHPESVESAPSGGKTDEALLKTLCLYWFTKTSGTAMIPYAANPYLPDIHRDSKNYLEVPTGYSDYPWEIVNTPFVWAKKNANIIWHARALKGGHFAAIEEPDIFVQHLKRAFAPGGGGKELPEDTIVKGLWDEERKKGWPAAAAAQE